MSQEKIAKQLKAFTIAVAIIGVGFFAAIFGFVLTDESGSGFPTGIGLVPSIVLIAVTAVLCFAILFEFWKVCTQIGKNNSFSKENYISFRSMSRILLTLAIIWLLFTIYYLIFADMVLFGLFKMVEIMVILLGVSALSGLLAKLIEKAREIREENDLTI